MFKKLQQSKDLLIQFDEDDIAQLGIKVGDKFSVISHEDGSIELKKFVPVEIDLSDYPRDILEFLINESIQKDITVSEVINDSLNNFIKGGYTVKEAA